MTAAPASLALLTPSFRGDVGRCELLVESVRRLRPATDHYLIVSHRDLAMFRHLEGDGTVLVEASELLPPGMHLLPTRRTIYLSRRTPPVRGWIIQQVLKIAMTAQLEHDVVACCDSDICFVRPFDIDDFLVDGRPGLIDRSDVDGEVVDWTDVARRLLGVGGPEEIPPRQHIGNVVCWRPPVARALIERIGEVTGLDWRHALCRNFRFSEYILYGMYVRAVMGYDASGHAPLPERLTLDSWGRDIVTPEGRAAFFADVDRHVAVMLHSKDGVEVDDYREFIERLWRRY